MSNYVVFSASLHDIPDIIGLSDVYLSKNYLKSGQMLSMINGLNCTVKCAKDVANKEVVGFATAHFLNARNSKVRNGVLKTVVVSPEHRNKGVAYNLSVECIDFLRENNASHIYSTAHKGMNGVYLLEALGFSYMNELQDYWKDYSITHNCDCSFCGLPPCRCSALLYGCSIVKEGGITA